MAKQLTTTAGFKAGAFAGSPVPLMPSNSYRIVLLLTNDSKTDEVFVGSTATSQTGSLLAVVPPLGFMEIDGYKIGSAIEVPLFADCADVTATLFAIEVSLAH